MRHRIDPLIAERAGWLHRPGPIMGAARRITEHLLDYDETLRVAEHIQDMTSHQIMQNMAARLANHVVVAGLHRVPKNGPALIVANHPTGIADGIFLYHALAQRRTDLFFYANSDILRVLPQMKELVVPVEWRIGKRSHAKTRETMRQTTLALKDGKIGVIFPSGRLARRRGLRLFERDWIPSAAMIARKFDAPVVPVHIAARNSVLFYVLDMIHPTLRDVTLFHETLNKNRQPYTMTFGAPISPRHLPGHAQEAITLLKDAILELGGRNGPAVSLMRTSPLRNSLV